MKSEEILLVDLDDNVRGYCSKMDAHKYGELHRAFSVFIVNNNGQMLLQKRNKNKYHSGGLWTNACCSHQRKDEELLQSIHRRLFEELGMDCELKEEFSFVYRQEYDGLYEYEIDHVFLGKYSGEISLNLEEASEYLWMDIEELKKKLLECPEKYTSWFIIAAPRVIKILEM